MDNWGTPLKISTGRLRIGGFGFALATRQSSPATAFFQSLHFFIRLRANSRRFHDIPKINRYKITLFPLESLSGPDLQVRRKAAAARASRVSGFVLTNPDMNNIAPFSAALFASAKWIEFFLATRHSPLPKRDA